MKTMIDFENYCTTEQVERAYRLGAPIGKVFEVLSELSVYLEENGKVSYLEIPTTSQMINWIREEKKFDIVIQKEPTNNGSRIVFAVYNTNIYANCHSYDCIKFGYTEDYEQAERSAIEAALDYLEKIDEN